jgi:cytochrome d ubiquinol oxidase subunit I
VTTNAFMQHPIGHELGPDGSFHLHDLSAFVFNRWALVQYAHTMMGAVVTGAFAVAAVGGYWTLRGERHEMARVSLATGVSIGLVASVLVAIPTGHMQGRLVADHQPVALAAMEGRFESGPRAPMAMIGQPNLAQRRLDNPLHLPALLSYIAYGDFSANVRGLDSFPEQDWPDNIELLYYSFHIMVGLGTLFIALMGVSAVQLIRARLETSRALLWMIGLAFPFPFIANTAGWMTAELGRQPWLVYGLMRTAVGGSPTVHGGSTLFTTLGFAGLYLVLGLLFVMLVLREIGHDARHPATAQLGGARQ